MKFTKEQRLDIGQKIYNDEMTRAEAAEAYGIPLTTARDYMRLYRDEHRLPPKPARKYRRDTVAAAVQVNPVKVNPGRVSDLDDLEAMSKEELVREVIMARIREARLKKGYEVKGDGTVILYDSKNIR